jgi:prevent-host-death family protein
MGIVVGAFEAKTKLAELLDKVESGDVVTNTGEARLQPVDADDSEDLARP